MRFIPDASVSLAWFLPEEDPAAREYADAVNGAIGKHIAFAVVPLNWRQEVASVLMRRLRSGSLPREAFERAKRYGLQVGDAVYFDLAYVLGLPIATLDGGLKAAAKAHGVKLFDPA